MEFFHAAMAPFTIALIVMAVIAAIEVMGMVFGVGASDAIDSLIPDIEIDADIDGPDASGLNAVGGILNWLCIGRVPILILFSAMLAGFGLAGLTAQTIMHGATGVYLPGWIAIIGALLAALPFTRWVGLGVAKVVPKEETDAVSSDSFVGKVAKIIRGTAKINQPAEAKLRDSFGATHYVLVTPEDVDVSLTEGTEVLLLERNGAVFTVIENTNSALSTT